jgi:hypothetical protein
MKALQPASARALTSMAALVMVAGFLVLAPSGAFLAYCLAALLAVLPAIFGTGKTRIIAAIILLCSAGLAARQYPEFKSEQERYRQRTKST